MSDVPDLGLDLENLFQPAWAKGKPEANPFEKFTGDEGTRPERRRGRPGFDRPRREFGGGEPRGERPRFGKKPGGRQDFRRGGDRGDRGERSDRGERRERPEAPAPLPEITVTFLADEKGVEQLARQIRMTGRAYPLFQIAQLVLQKPERYSVQLAVKKKSVPAAPAAEGEAPKAPETTVVQPLFVCALDETPWLSADEVVAHVLKDHFATFYQAERTATEPPKGTYTFVAQCGMSGVILGPPNYHDYQNQLRKLHAERFSRMPFDVFKARVKIVKDEAVVKKWIEEQSFKTEYICLNVPEPLKLPSLEEVEKHFRATHKDSIVKQVETVTVDGTKSRNLRSRELYRLVRLEWENQKRFPLQLATALSKLFASHGLQFFKVNKTVVHVSVARPQYLDLEATPVSENVKRIVEFINANPKCTRRKMIETLAPAPKPPVVEAKPEESTEPKEPKVESPAEPTPEQTALVADLHWLIHQGHVLEFADGRMETAKKPAPRPPKPEKKAGDGKPAEEKPAAEGEAASDAQVASPEIISSPAETPVAAEPASSAEPATTTESAPAAAEAPRSESGPDDAKPTEPVPSPS